MIEPGCKGCRETVAITDKEIDLIFNRSLKVKNVNTADSEKYESRIKVCKVCEGLQYGTTCRYCGCLVKIKAKLAASKCAYPYEPKW